jgi:hypothetical protein
MFDRAKKRHRPRTFRPLVEKLEDRLLMATAHFAIDPQQDVHAVSRFIYGVNESLEGNYANGTFTRLGGNRWTAYNWENNASNAGSDWYFQNDAYLGGGNTPGGAVIPRLQNASARNAGTLLTVPINGYVAADKNGGGDVRNSGSNYLQTRFRQEVAAKDAVFSLTPDTTDAYVYQDEFVNWVNTNYPYGQSDPNRPIFYALDNEPDLWASTHAEVHPSATTYAELVSKTIAYADAIKDVAPDSLVFGPVNYGWHGYTTLQDAPDGAGRDFQAFYLQQLAQAEMTTGHRLLDVLDVHWYPEATGGGVRITEQNNTDAVVAARLQAPRSLWDPTYTETSWITQWSTFGPINLLPRLQGKITQNYPGTTLAITEYNYGGGNHISGGIAQADVLGVLGREGVFAANEWPLAADESFIQGGFRMFRNFDGANGSFGDTSVRATTDDVAGTSVYASVDSSDPNVLIVVAINKTNASMPAVMQLAHVLPGATVATYRLTSASSVPQAAGTATITDPASFTITMPAYSVNTLRIVGLNSTNAAPTVAAPAAATPNPVTGTTTALSVLGADDGGESSLVYTWAVVGTPPAAVAFSANGTNGAKNVTATFAATGSYTFRATISDGVLSATSDVVVTVHPTLTSIVVSPVTASISTGATQQFTAVARDQFGASLAPQPAFAWLVFSGGGTISSTGLYTAPATAGTATIRATSGSVFGTATVTLAVTRAAGNAAWSLWSSGRTMLRGANIFQAPVWPELDGDWKGSGPVGPPFSQAEFDALAAAGANYVNISHPGLFAHQAPYALDQGARQNLDHLLAMIAQADMFATIGFRTGPGRSEFTNEEPAYRDDTVWESQAAQDAWAQMWRYTAERYRDNPIVVGYDLMVEPNAAGLLDIWDPETFYAQYAHTLRDWNRMFPPIVAAIRQVDADTPLLVGGEGFSSPEWLPAIVPTSDPRTVYTIHQYEPHLYTHQDVNDNRPYPGNWDVDYDNEPDPFNAAWLDARLAIADTFTAQHGVPVAANEYGLRRWAPGAVEYLTDQLQLFEQHGLNHAIWSWNPSYELWNVHIDDFDYRHGPDPHHHTDLADNPLIQALTQNWALNTIRPSNWQGNPWHNARHPADVDGNTRVEPLDVLTLINYINAHPSSAALPAPPAAPPPYYDVNGNNTITPSDVLIVINYLNGRAAPRTNPRGIDPSAWVITDSAGHVLAGLADNNPDTHVDLSRSGATPPRLVIDLGETTMIARVFIAGQNRSIPYWGRLFSAEPEEPEEPAGMIRAYVGDSPAAINTFAGEYMVPPDVGALADLQADLRFSPVSGRYIRVELQTVVNWSAYNPGAWNDVTEISNLAWRVGEIEVHGFQGAGAFVKTDAVVVPADVARPLQLAALELSYYLGKLTDKPVPIITDAQVSQYPGTLYRVMDLVALAPDYATMKANEENGSLPTNLNVEISGREVRFKSWPYRNVLATVWNFLDYQGVRWLAPDAHGDYVPATGTVNLDLAAMPTSRSAKAIYTNWNASGFQPWVEGRTQTIRQEYLYLWRNGWTTGWNDPAILGGSEVPPIPTHGTIPPEYLYAENMTGFELYPHNLTKVVPPSWWTTDDLGRSVLDMTNRSLIEWVADKMIAVESVQARDPDAIRHYQQVYNLLPEDATAYYQSATTDALNSPVHSNDIAWGAGPSQSQSGAYYYFVNEVAKRVKQLRPDLPIVVGALAYADVLLPPPIDASNPYFKPGFHFEDNVRVEVCLYGSPNLPLDAPANAAMKSLLNEWRALVTHMTAYEYTLLHEDAGEVVNPQFPIAAVNGIAGAARYLAAIDALDGGTQGSHQSIPYNPWNFYAYPKIRENASLTTAQILDDFFTGYFQEAGSAMLAYYTALENYQVQNNVVLHSPRDFYYLITPGSFPVGVLAQMEPRLAAAEAATQTAQHWVVKERVAKIRESFNYILAQRGLTGVNLNDTSRYQAVGLDRSPVALDLARFTTPDQGRWGNYAEYNPSDNPGGWKFWAQGVITQMLYFTQGGTYQVKIRAWGVPTDDGIWPIMQVYAGPMLIGSVEVASGTADDYFFTVNIPAGFGVQDLWISYQNGADRGARNLLISGISMTRTSGP